MTLKFEKDKLPEQIAGAEIKLKYYVKHRAFGAVFIPGKFKVLEADEDKGKAIWVKGRGDYLVIDSGGWPSMVKKEAFEKFYTFASGLRADQFGFAKENLQSLGLTKGFSTALLRAIEVLISGKGFPGSPKTQENILSLFAKVGEGLKKKEELEKPADNLTAPLPKSLVQGS